MGLRRVTQRALLCDGPMYRYLYLCMGSATEAEQNLPCQERLRTEKFPAGYEHLNENYVKWAIPSGREMNV